MAQSTFVPYNRDYYHLIDRFQIKYQDKQNLLPVTFKPVRRSDLSTFLDHVKTKYDSLSPQDQFNFQFLYNDNWQWTESEYNTNDKSWWNLAYDKKSDFMFYKSDKATIRINPVADFRFGRDGNQDGTLYTNTRGLEAQGMIDDKIGFYTFLTTTQARFADYVSDRVLSARAFPNEGNWKENGNVFDVTHARGYFTFNLTPSIDVQAGYDKNFIGNGLRSMVLSDFSSPYLFLKINTRIGPFQYTNLFAELTEDIIFGGGGPADGDYPNKYMAFHRIGVNITPDFEFGLYESIISARANINYFNPIVFYRAIEQQRGSPDNILLGMDFKWNIKNRYQVYGQFMLDEFKIDELRSGDGSWRNKFGAQLGAKYIDAFDIATLDLQMEFNLARPFFYAYETPSLSYTNFRNPLAHPMGANFKEVVLTARYQPINKLFITGKIIRSNTGEDDQNINYGGNLLVSTDTRVADFGNSIGQGVSATNTYIELAGSYMLIHNLFLDARFIFRNFKSDDSSRSSDGLIPMISLRWNLPTRQHEF
ncbi:MAG: hypothetical protein Roseis2KO_18520 [Roseivirga sp.]